MFLPYLPFKLPASLAAFFIESKSSPRWWYRPFTRRDFFFAIAYAVSRGSATVESM